MSAALYSREVLLITPAQRGVLVPSASKIQGIRSALGLSQAAAGRALNSQTANPHRTWQSYETPEHLANHRAIPEAVWELFLLLSDNHPTLKLVAK